MKPSSPSKGKIAATNARGASPKNFRWNMQKETVLINLFLVEEAIGNRIGGTFTLTAYKNIIAELNSIFDTQIHKNNVQNKLRLMKGHYAQFKNAFASMSGFAWNVDSKRFEAEDEIWDTLIRGNPSNASLRYKTVNNSDKLDLLFAGTTVTSAMCNSGRDMHERIKRRLDVDSASSHREFRPTQPVSQSENCANASGGQTYLNDSDKDTQVQHSGSQHSSGKGMSKRKYKEAELFDFDKASDKMLLGMEKMCTTIMSSAKELGRINGDRNKKVLEELKALDLRRTYLIRCYQYLFDNPSAATAFLSLPHEFRKEILLEQVGHDDMADVDKPAGDN